MLRTARERLLQTLTFEAGGLVIAAPAYGLATGAAPQDSVVLVVAMSATVLVWTPLFNSACDRLEWRRAGRVASDRPLRWRFAHAVAHEMSLMVVTLPILIWLGGHTLAEAVVIDLAFTAVYTAWTLVFHRLWDWAFPVGGRRSPSVPVSKVP
ncbi:MAG: hypothetical protein MUF73_03195 [Rhodobacteraceae bacterium]|jgi:uncharacterized membrane protein|nr:hypothetical protein [Paracoccaceae bacterium]